LGGLDDDDEESGARKMGGVSDDVEEAVSGVVMRSNLEVRLSPTYKVRFVEGTGDSCHRVVRRDISHINSKEREREAEIVKKRKERWETWLVQRSKPADVVVGTPVPVTSATAAPDYAQSLQIIPVNGSGIEESESAENGPDRMDVD
jgi:hypothetical protein